MERVKIFYWRAPLLIPQTEQNFQTTEIVWHLGEEFTRQEGSGWRVISNSVVVVLPDEQRIIMATTLAQDVDESWTDAL